MYRLFPPESDAIVEIHDQLAHFADVKVGMPVEMLTRDQISMLVETAFWASLKSNEGRHTRVLARIVWEQAAYLAILVLLPLFSRRR